MNASYHEGLSWRAGRDCSPLLPAVRLRSLVLRLRQRGKVARAFLPTQCARPKAPVSGSVSVLPSREQEEWAALAEWAVPAEWAAKRTRSHLDE